MSRPVSASPASADTAASPLLDDGHDLVVVNEQAGDLGGTERVLDAVLSRYPAARLVALRFGGGNVDGGEGVPWPNPATVVDAGARKRHFLAPLYARRTARLPLGEGRIVLSLAHAGWPLAATLPEGARHVCYRAGAPRSLYGGTHLFLADYGPAARVAVRAALPALRAHDRRLMRRCDRVLTNSHGSKRAIERVYGRTAELVHPPVRTAFFTAREAERTHLLVVARLSRYKQVDAVTEAMRRLPGERLVVVGGGPLLDALRAGAPANVRFTGHVDDAELRALYRSARALVCPSVEEFGLVMAEAHACGTPVIAPNAGGAREIVDDPRTGVLVERADPASLADAVGTLARTGFDPGACRRSALRFAEERFLATFARVLAEERALAG